MNLLNSIPNQKFSGVVLGLIVLMAFRMSVLFQEFNSNYRLIIINQYPAWQAVAEKNLPQMPSFLESRLKQSTENLSLAQGYGLILFGHGKVDEAIGIWQEVGLSPAKVVVIQARYALTVGQPEIALTWFEHAVELEPISGPSWDALGDLYIQKNQMELGISAYEEAVRFGSSASVDPLAKLWRDHGEHVKAITLWNTALDTFPNAPERLAWWQGLSNSLRATEQWEIGNEVVDRGLNEFPNDARLYVEKGAIIYGRSADTVAAMNALEKAIALDDTIPGAYSTAASIMAEEKQYEAAYDWYSKAISLDPSKASFYIARGHMARAAGNLQLALEEFELAIDNFPSFSPAYFGIARVYKELHDKENAVIAVDQGLKFNEANDVQYYLQAAEIYEWSGHLEMAILIYQLVLTQDSGNVRANQALQQLQKDD